MRLGEYGHVDGHFCWGSYESCKPAIMRRCVNVIYLMDYFGQTACKDCSLVGPGLVLIDIPCVVRPSARALPALMWVRDLCHIVPRGEDGSCMWHGLVEASGRVG